MNSFDESHSFAKYVSKTCIDSVREHLNAPNNKQSKSDGNSLVERMKRLATGDLTNVNIGKSD